MNQKPTPSARKTKLWLATLLWAAMLFTALPSRAQFTGDNQTNIISGTAVNWPSDYYVGSNYISDALFILNGGSLSNRLGYVGRMPGANSNLVVVSGSGSTWTNNLSLYVGYDGSANRLVVSDGGRVTSTGDVIAGTGFSSISNSIVITGSGSVLTTPVSIRGLQVGDAGAYCSLVISNGGAAFCGHGIVGGGYGGSNTAIVTGSGSVWSNSSSLIVGVSHSWNTLIVSNGGAVCNSDARIGDSDNARNNSVLITGSGSLWRGSGTLYVGYGVGSTNAFNNRLTVADGGSVLASNAYVGFSAGASNSLIQVSGGNLTVTNVSGTGILNVRRGRLAFDGGTITTDQLWLTNGVQSILEFNSGTLHSKATVVSNTQPCVIGDGVASANFHLLGGVHSFNDGLRIRASGFLSGCGTVNGSVVVDAGGAVHANCTNLVFNSAVTNNGAMVVDGAVLETFGTFVNNGKIYLINGGTTNFHGTFINAGQILNGDIHLAIERDGSGGLFIRYTGAPDVTYRLQRAASVTGTWSDLATNAAPASGPIEYHEISPPPGQAFYRTVQP